MHQTVIVKKPQADGFGGEYPDVVIGCGRGSGAGIATVLAE
jgi:hypothetical protein